MTKIKNFRITLRPREIARWLKNRHQMPTTPEVELAVDSTIKNAKSAIHPAAVYTTLTRATAEKATSLVFPEKSIAASVIAVTIGDALEAQIQAHADSEESQSRLLQAVKEEALQQSIQFAVRLLQEQAKEEECELSAPVLAEDLSLLLSLTTLLGSSRIGIDVDPKEPVWPSHARLVWTYWTPVRRSSKKGETSRAAKAAA